MIKVYEITFLGKHFLRQTFYDLNLREYQDALRMYKEDAPQGIFLFNTEEGLEDHPFKQHIAYLEKNKLIKRNRDKEQEVKDFLRSRPKDEIPEVQVFRDLLGIE